MFIGSNRRTNARQVPTNERLYAMVVFQAKAKYQTYPSPGASHWVHRRYLELGGRFEDASEKAYRDRLRQHAVDEYRRKQLAHGEEGHDSKRNKGDKKHEKKNTKKRGDK